MSTQEIVAQIGTGPKRITISKDETGKFYCSRCVTQSPGTCGHVAAYAAGLNGRPDRSASAPGEPIGGDWRSAFESGDRVAIIIGGPEGPNVRGLAIGSASPADAARIVACVNACDGVPNEVLEAKKRPVDGLFRLFAVIGPLLTLEQMTEASKRAGRSVANTIETLGVIGEQVRTRMTLDKIETVDGPPEESGPAGDIPF